MILTIPVAGMNKRFVPVLKLHGKVKFGNTLDDLRKFFDNLYSVCYIPHVIICHLKNK
jgi:hypothetical protein